MTRKAIGWTALALGGAVFAVIFAYYVMIKIATLPEMPL